ncbi:MAG: M6 family metalloprotease domain-containing protein [Porphyromonadaceae bacterium]|nr:MAG: M6 family metalloprotease domain-containing protein [Porphyromonadaceae bacterium]
MKTRGLDLLVGLKGAFKVLRMTRIFIAVFVVTCFCNLSLQAAYLKNVPQTFTQPDGTILKCFATGDEYHHWLHDANNFTILQDPVTGFYVYAIRSGSKLVPTSFIAGKTDPVTIGLQPGVNLDAQEVQLRSKDMFRIPALKGSSEVTTTGTINNIVIFIRFNDQAEYTDPITKYSLAFNSTGSVSMGEYFKEVSGSQLTVNTSLFPQTGGASVVSYQDAMTRNYYCKYNSVTNPNGYQNDTERFDREMTLLKNATEAVRAQIESTGLNYDNDNNGQIDNVCYIIQGSTDGWSDLLWPHMFKLYSYNVTIGSAKVWNYNLQLSETFRVNVLCHEMSHSLGFPDLYRYTNNTINPVSSWDVMASTTNPPQHPSVYLKQKYGKWISSIPEISTNGTYTLKPLSSDPFAGYKISSPNSTSEYFMVEYRKTTGIFESQLLGSGLIIYRVNPSLNGNNFGPPDEVYVFRPDGTTTVDGNLAQANFSSNESRTSFGSNSNTTCFLSDGSPGGFQITNIGTAGETISFSVNFGNTPSPSLTLEPVIRDVAVTAGTTNFTVSNTGGGTLTWTADVTTGSNWAHITSGFSGSNSGSILVSVDANTESTPRNAIITVTAADATGSPKTLNILQAANESMLNVGPENQVVAFTGATTTFAVSNSGGGIMSWVADITTGSNWAHINSGFSGNNSGSILVSVDANTENDPRTAVIMVTAADAAGSPKTLNIVQAANPSGLNVTPDSRNLPFGSGIGTFTVSNTGGGTMSWIAAVTTGNSWAHINSGFSGNNGGSIQVSVDFNPESAPRTAVITVTAADAAGSPKTINVVQAANGSVLNVGPENQNVAFGGATTDFTVSNIGGGTMRWSAAVTSGSSWVKIISGASGSNDGRITVAIDANTGVPRTAIITVTSTDSIESQKTLTIMQDISNGINTLNIENKLNVYPNPVDKQCTVQIEEFNGIPQKLEVFNMMGQLESSQSLNQERMIIDMSTLPQGIYLFRLTSETNILSQRRIVKN